MGPYWIEVKQEFGCTNTATGKSIQSVGKFCYDKLRRERFFYTSSGFGYKHLRSTSTADEADENTNLSEDPKTSYHTARRLLDEKELEFILSQWRAQNPTRQ